MNKVDIIIPTYKSKLLTTLCLRSFEKFKGDNDFKYIVVENSNDVSYKEEILSISPGNILWVQNPTDLRLSHANAVALEKGLEYVTSKYVFMCHNDVMACHPNWMNFLINKLKKENYSAAAFNKDTARINALHISGLLTLSNIAKNVSFYPAYDDGGIMIMDVGDSITKFCRDKKLNYYCCENTHNDRSLSLKCKPPYDQLHYITRSFSVDPVNNYDVLYLHLGRGIQKSQGQYFKKGRLGIPEWRAFALNSLNLEAISC